MINYNSTFTFNQYDVMKLTEKEWNKDVAKHYKKVKELTETEVISIETVNELLNNNYSFTLVVKNENPYFHKDCYLVTLYFNYCSSKPVTVYINKEYLNMITGQVNEEVVTEQTEVNEIIETPVKNEETTYYTVGNTSFNHLYQAQEYCDNNDFDYSLIKEIGNTINNKQTKVKTIFWYEYTLRGFSIGCQPKGFIEHDPTKGKYGIIAYDRILTEKELYEYDLKLHSASFKAA